MTAPVATCAEPIFGKCETCVHGKGREHDDVCGANHIKAEYDRTGRDCPDKPRGVYDPKP